MHCNQIQMIRLNKFTENEKLACSQIHMSRLNKTAIHTPMKLLKHCSGTVHPMPVGSSRLMTHATEETLVAFGGPSAPRAAKVGGAVATGN